MIDWCVLVVGVGIMAALVVWWGDDPGADAHSDAHRRRMAEYDQKEKEEARQYHDERQRYLKWCQEPSVAKPAAESADTQSGEAEADRDDAMPSRERPLFVQPDAVEPASRLDALKFGVRKLALMRLENRDLREMFEIPTISERARMVRLITEQLRNFEDPAFRQAYASRRYRMVLRAAEGIRLRYFCILDDQELVNYLEQHDPVVLKRIEGCLETILVAERVAVASPARSKVAKTSVSATNEMCVTPPPQPLPVGRRERVVARLGSLAGDHRALIEKFLRERDEMMGRLKELVRDEDEQERWLRTFEDALAAELERLQRSGGEE